MDSNHRKAEGAGTFLETEAVSFRESRIHGRGGFARRELKSGERVIEYVGEVISKAESLARCEQNNEYIFALSETEDLDGSVSWNPARFLNHSCGPNCEALLEQGRIWIVALREIQPGEEITFNYGYDLEDYQDHPCHCGAAGCVGYIVAEEFFARVRGKKGIEHPQKHCMEEG